MFCATHTPVRFHPHEVLESETWSLLQVGRRLRRPSGFQRPPGGGWEDIFGELRRQATQRCGLGDGFEHLSQVVPFLFSGGAEAGIPQTLSSALSPNQPVLSKPHRCSSKLLLRCFSIGKVDKIFVETQALKGGGINSWNGESFRFLNLESIAHIWFDFRGYVTFALELRVRLLSGSIGSATPF